MSTAENHAIRLRQVALVAHELDPVVEDLCTVFAIDVAYRDPGVETFGLRNAVIPIGETFLEVVSPIQAGTTAGRLLERRRGDGGYMVILQTEDPARERRRVEELGVRVVWEIELERAATFHLHPRDIGGAIVSFDTMDPPESWAWAGPDWRQHVRTDRVRAIIGVEIQAHDPRGTADRWAQILGYFPVHPRATGFEIELGEATVRVVPDTNGRGDGVSGIDLHVRDPDAVLERARACGLETTQSSVFLGGVLFRLSGHVPAGDGSSNDSTV